jgi:uncharacterized protein (TIGR02597 family)
VIVPPDSYFIVRHNHATITQSTSFVSKGGVELDDFALVMNSSADGYQDNHMSLGRPIGVKLSNLDLTSANFVDSLGSLTTQRRDLLVVFDNAVAQINRGPTATYYRFSGNWYKVGGGAATFNDDELPPSSGFFIRKYKSAAAQSSVWVSNPFTN